MSKLLFPILTANDVECRVSSVKKDERSSGVQLLLYKNARCDMRILDETVGPERWQREHYECKGNLFCRVGILFDGEWVWKSDCGTESNTEKEKGEASDSFKRACFNWGIGRELYTAPFIWIPEKDKSGNTCVELSQRSGKYVTYNRFVVKDMKVVDGKIVALKIENASLKRVVFEMGRVEAPQKATGVKTIKTIENLIDQKGWTIKACLEYCKEKWGVDALEALTDKQAAELIASLNKKKDKE